MTSWERREEERMGESQRKRKKGNIGEKKNKGHKILNLLHKL